MNLFKKSACSLLIAAVTMSSNAVAVIGGDGSQSTSLTYQGVLENEGTRVSESLFFKFTVWTSQDIGEGQELDKSEQVVEIIDGLFQAELQFNRNTWEGTQTWLQIEIRPVDGDDDELVIVGNRQKITAAPYAVTIVGVKNSSNYVQIGNSSDPKDLRVPNGRVGIGTNNPQDQLDVRGIIRSEGVRLIGGADIAEPFDVVSDSLVVPGMVVAIDPDNPGQLELSTTAYNHRVAGIISGANGINPALTLSQKGTIADGEYPVALTGRVWCFVDADANGPVIPGDMLTTSDVQGHAMKADDRNRAFGATIGKAMTSLDEGQGLVLVLVNLQ
ncbi:MAG: hypothetical protein P1U42_03740 [Phycisphaerales bacterium]|nr:hypothetical protein [Phycisphaerales bacterium]